MKDKSLGWLNGQVFWQTLLRSMVSWVANRSEEMERISDCCEKGYCWYFIYIVQHGNGVKRNHSACGKKGCPGKGTQSLEETEVD